jgi:hypothetical protein
MDQLDTTAVLVLDSGWGCLKDIPLCSVASYAISKPKARPTDVEFILLRHKKACEHLRVAHAHIQRDHPTVRKEPAW